MMALTPLQLFKLLAGDTRVRLALLLRGPGELCVCGLTSPLN
ncbi:transcriptional regulator, partial [Cronobacter sakazakii]